MSGINYSTPSDHIKQFLKDMGQSVSIFAFQCGLTESAASRIVCGWEIPKDPVRRRLIAKWFGKPESELWPNINPTDPQPRERVGH